MYVRKYPIKSEKIQRPNYSMYQKDTPYPLLLIVELEKKHLENVKEINRYENRRAKNSGAWIFTLDFFHFEF